MSCPPGCELCRVSETRIDPDVQPPGILEAAMAGAGVATSVWFAGWIIYSIGSWVDRAGAGTASLIWSVTLGALAAVFVVTVGRR